MLGIRLGDIEISKFCPLTFSFEVNSRQAEKCQVVAEGYFCYEMLNIGFFPLQTLIASIRRFNNRSN